MSPIDDQQPVLGRDPGEGVHHPPLVSSFAKDDIGFERRPLEDASAEPRRGLKQTGAVDDEGVAGEPNLSAAHETDEDLEVDGSAENPRFGSILSTDCDDEMGNAAEAKEHV